MADPGFANGWADHGERAKGKPYKRGYGAEPPVCSMGKDPCGGEAESFLSIFIQKSGQKSRIYMKILPRV